MKKIIGSLLALFASAAFGTTLVPIQLLNPTGSTANQALVSAGPSAVPTWAAVANSVAGRSGTVTLAVADVSGAAPLASPTFTGTVTIPGGASISGYLTTASAASTYAPLASPTFTGTVTATNITASGTLTGFPGRLLNVQVITSTQTYTPTTGTNSVIVVTTGGGGGSGGNAVTTAGQNAASGGGGSAGFAMVKFTSGFSGVTATVGTGGTAGAAGANAGGTGVTSSFGGLISCPGGGGGGGGTALTALGAGGSGGSGSATCTVSGGTTILLSKGQAGTAGQVFVIGSDLVGGGGGSTVIGIGAAALGGGAPGLGGGYGSGAGGFISVASTAAAAGAAGQPGVIIVYEYQ